MEPMDEDDFFHLKLKSYRNGLLVSRVCGYVRLLVLRHIMHTVLLPANSSFLSGVGTIGEEIRCCSQNEDDAVDFCPNRQAPTCSV